VNDTSDLIDDNLADGICHTTTGTCTLRAAIMQTNALGGANTIILPTGIYTLTLGELAIQNDLTIDGSGKDGTIIDASGNSRDFHVVASVQVIITGLTIRNGSALVGGAISSGVNDGSPIIQYDSFLTVTNSAIVGSHGQAMGGGIFNYAHLALENVIISGNTSPTIGGIYNFGVASLDNVSLNSNTATGNGNGGGIGNYGVLTSSTVSEKEQKDHIRSGFALL
jgi:hypothetical protein